MAIISLSFHPFKKKRISTSVFQNAPIAWCTDAQKTSLSSLRIGGKKLFSVAKDYSPTRSAPLGGSLFESTGGCIGTLNVFVGSLVIPGKFPKVQWNRSQPPTSHSL
jgi:hypothetical protein